MAKEKKIKDIRNFDKSNKIKTLLFIVKSIDNGKKYPYRMKARILLSVSKTSSYEINGGNKKFRYMNLDSYRGSVDIYKFNRVAKRKMEMFRLWV
jgi:hypothetical protein